MEPGTVPDVRVVVRALHLEGDLAGVNARVDDVRTDLGGRMDRIEARLDGFERLRQVEIAFGKVDQRLLTIERVVLPAAARGE